MKLGWLGAGALVVGLLGLAEAGTPGSAGKAGSSITQAVAAAAPPVLMVGEGAMQIIARLLQDGFGIISTVLPAPPQQTVPA